MKKENDNLTGSVAVVGGGVGGIQASLDLAESGFKVYLIDKCPAIGGVMAQLDKTFPTNDCAMCTLAPRLVDAGKHLNIEKIMHTDVTKVEGEPGNLRLTLKKHARYIDLSKCTGCSLCVEKCPIKVDSEFDINLIKRAAIYKRYPQAVPSAFSIDKQDVAPCRFGCPAGVNAHAYVSLIAEGRFQDALCVEKRENPFPAICGRICPHACELECKRGELDEPIAIAELKRFIADWEFANPDKKPPLPKNLKSRKEKIAVIGSGPAGLSCSHYLAMKGYNVTIFEALTVPGGMLSVGIPEYRLPKKILETEIKNAVTDLGVELKLNTRVNSLEELKNFDAVFVGIGAHKGMNLNIPGENHEGVIDAVEFLRNANLGKETKVKGKNVVVISGGNMAFDSARIAVRLGAKTVTIAYRRTSRELPANSWEINQAREEGIKIQELVAPVEIIAENGKVRKIKFIRMQTGEPDKSGRVRPVPVKGSEFEIEADIVIPAVSQQIDISFISKINLNLLKSGFISVDEVTLQTNIPNVFAGGDAVSGPATAIEAIEAGKQAAISIDKYLNKEDMKAGRIKPEWKKSEKEIKGLAKKKRIKPQLVDPQKRKLDFTEISMGYTQEEALKEAKRCLDCAVCCECLLCVEACEAKAINHEMPKEETVKLNVGAVILAPGFELFDPELKKEFGYGRYPNVLSSLQFERILSPSGPTMGHVLKPSDSKPPQKIAFIQCVGSREADRNYCSSVCCMYATKEAIIAMEHQKGLECHIFFIDVRAFSKGFEQYYEQAKKQGVRYTRARPSSIKQNETNKNLLIQYETENNERTTEEFDMVVLSCGLSPHKDVAKLAEAFKVKLNEHGFCHTTDFAPVETSRQGIYVCGPFSEPKDIPETVMQASGSAAKAMAMLAKVRDTLTVKKEYPPETDVSGQEPRVGVFVCHCGKNIGGVINVPNVAEYAKTLPNVVFAQDNLYTCSADSCENIKKMIKEHNLNRVIVASCTPRTHEPLFRNTVREAGLNEYLFEMANIRDQNTWVHMHENEAAFRKAKDLVRIATAKARLLEPLRKGKLNVNPNALVIGGGLAGMTAALELANQGFETHLVEKEKELGGNLNRLHYLLSGEKPKEKLPEIINRVKSHEKIRLYTQAQVTSVEGSIGNFKSVIDAGGKTNEINHGIIIVATGADEYKPAEYLYGKDPNVLTQLELEEKLATPTSNLSPLTSVVMIQCVGSRIDERPYCSRLCCSEAIKNAIKLKEINPETDVYILYRDIRAYGFKETYYTKARELGVRFIRYNDDEKPEVSKANGRLKVSTIDHIMNVKLDIPADLVVLSPATVPNPGNENLAQKLKVPLNADKFFLEAHMKLKPVEFATDGIFLCGLAHFPKTVDETIGQAMAAAAKAATIISKPVIELDAAISQVIDESCDGCAYCIDPCPYKAITLIEYMKDGAIKKTVQSDPALCKGCGVCMATCPKKGIHVNHFKLEQLMAMVYAALEVPSEVEVNK